MKLVKVVCGYVVLLLAAALISGCERAEPQPSVAQKPRMQNLKGALAEYREESSNLDLPPGVTWQLDPFTDENGRYEVGIGISAADDFWRCKWLVEWLDNRDSADRSTRALHQLEKYTGLHMYRRLDDKGRQLHQEMMQQASLGTPTLIAQYVEANSCRAP